MAKYRIIHKTTYDYVYPVTASHHAARLKPVSDASQECLSFRLKMRPQSVDLSERKDYFGNTAHLFSTQEPHQSLVVEALSLVERNTEAIDLESLKASVGELQADFADISRTDLIDPKQFLYESELTHISEEISQFAQRFLSPEKNIGAALQAMLDAFKDEFEFDPDATDIYTPIQETLSTKRGVCQDFAHLMIGALRSQGLPASYVSGYILTQPPPGMPRLVGADASHAWVSTYIPEVGWIDLDPTNRLVCGNQHVRVACGRDFRDVSMLGGAVTGGGDHNIKVEVTMSPIED